MFCIGNLFGNCLSFFLLLTPIANCSICSYTLYILLSFFITCNRLTSISTCVFWYTPMYQKNGNAVNGEGIFRSCWVNLMFGYLTGLKWLEVSGKEADIGMSQVKKLRRRGIIIIKVPFFENWAFLDMKIWKRCQLLFQREVERF